MEIPDLSIESDNQTEIKTDFVNGNSQRHQNTPIQDDIDDAELQEILAQPSKPTIDEILEKTKLILKLRRFAEFQKKNLEDFDLSREKLNELSTDDLRILLEQVKFSVGCRNSGDFFYKSVLGATNIAENMAVKFSSFRVQGLTFLLANDEEFKNVINEIALENQELTYLNPYQRLGYIFMKNALQLHQMNANREAIGVSISKPINADVKAKFNDL